MIHSMHRIRLKLESFPCLILLLGILNGFTALYFCDSVPSLQMIFLFPVPGILAAWGVFGLRNACYRFIPAVILAIAVSLFYHSRKEKEFLAVGMEKYERLGAVAVFRLTDPSLCGGVPAWMPNTPYYIQAELLEIPDFPGSRRPGGKVFLRAGSSSGAELAGYGDIVRATGYFERIPEQTFPGTFDFLSYAAARDCDLIFHAGTVLIEKRGSGILRSLYDARSRFLARLTSHMPEGNARDLVPALFFGIRQSVSGEVKDYFLSSGTLHILSVSGFHIGLFFTAVMLFFRCFPYRLRWLIAPVPVFIYAVSTGMQAPAFRAFIMLLFWCFSLALLKKSRGENTLAAAAALVLLQNPFQLFDTGFLYSFICVFFLLISFNFFHRVTVAMTVRDQFYKDRHSLSSRRIAAWVVNLIGVSSAVWLCSMELTLRFQSLFTPAAVPAYLPMLPVTYLCFILFLPGILLQWIPGSLEFLGCLMDPLLGLCAGVAGYFSAFGVLHVSPPPVWLVFLFLAALSGLFLLKRKIHLICCALILFLSGMISLLPALPAKPEIAVLRSGGVPVPSVVFCDPVSRMAMVWNIPSGKTARLVSDYLRIKGIKKIEEIHFDSSSGDLCGGGPLVLKTNGAKAVYFHSPIPVSAKTAHQIITVHPTPYSRPVLKWERNDDTVRVIPGIPGFEGVELRMIRSEDSGTTLILEQKGKPSLRKIYPFSTEVFIDRILL